MVYKWYILRDYMLPTTYWGNQETPLNWYIYLREWLIFFMVNVGIYIPYMDPMGMSADNVLTGTRCVFFLAGHDTDPKWWQLRASFLVEEVGLRSAIVFHFTGNWKSVSPDPLDPLTFSYFSHVTWTFLSSKHVTHGFNIRYMDSGISQQGVFSERVWD